MRIPLVNNSWIGLALTGVLLLIMPGGLLAFFLLLAGCLRRRPQFCRKIFAVWTNGQ